MNVLAFDTCLGALSVALRWRSARGEWLLCEAYEERQTGHAERLMPMIEEVLASAGLSMAEIGRIAVTTGPGTFTGVRTGIAAARGFHLALGIDVVGMSSLALIAERADRLLAKLRGDRPLVVAVDARRGQLYLQVFGENAGEPLSEPRLLEIAEAVAAIPGSAAVAVGSGAELLAAAACEFGIKLETAAHALEPHARGLAVLGHVLPKLEPILPLYLRPPDAKPQGDKSLPRSNV